MRSILVTVIAVGVLCGASARAAAPVGAGKVYSGPEGESVAVIPLKDAQEGKKFLLYVQGTDSEFDGKALAHELHEWNNNADHKTQYRGVEYNTLVVREAWGSRRYELYVPGRGKGIRVSFDEKRTQALKPEDIYALHRKQTSDGTLAKLAAFDRKGEVAEQEQLLAEALKALNAACGTAATASIDWSSVSDEVLKVYSVSSYCANPLSALQGLCDTAVGKKAIQAKVKKVSCRFGPELKLEVKAGTVSFTTTQDAANQEAFATQFFEKNL